MDACHSWTFLRGNDMKETGTTTTTAVQARPRVSAGEPLRGLAIWATVFRLLFALVRTPAVRGVRSAVQIGPIEAPVIVGARRVRGVLSPRLGSWAEPSPRP